MRKSGTTLLVMMIVNVRAAVKRGITRVGITAAVPSVLALAGMVYKAMIVPGGSGN